MVLDATPPIPDLPGLAGRKISWARAEDITSTPLRQIFGWWQQRIQTGQPGRSDFDVVDYLRIAPHLYLVDAAPGGFQLRLAGEEYIRLFGIKKGFVWRFDSSDPVMRDSAALLAFTLNIKRPIRTVGRLELIERRWIELEALVCPLAPGRDGVGKFLGCVAPIAPD